MDNALRQVVALHANNSCEYGGMKQEADPFFRFHIEHISPRKHGGATVETNLALACHHCNLHKGPNLSGIDAATNTIVTLFNPRTQIWHEHFVRNGQNILGITDIGRASVNVLAMNLPGRQRLHLRG